jgi:hypothetical protein
MLLIVSCSLDYHVYKVALDIQLTVLSNLYKGPQKNT